MAKKELMKRELETESPSYLQEVQERPLSLGCRVSGRLETEQTESQIALIRRREISPAHKDYSTVIPLGPHEPCTILPGRLSPSQPHLSLLVRVSFTKNYFLFIPTHCAFTAWFPLSHSVLLFTASCCPQLYAPSGLDITKHWQGDGEIAPSSMLVQPSEG